MKKNILSVLLMLVSFAAAAQTQTQAQNQGQNQNQNLEQTLKKRRVIDPSYRWYTQAHIMGSFSASEDLRYNRIIDPLGWGADFAIGYNFNDFLGLYGEISYNKNKGASGVNPAILTNETRTTFTFDSWEPTIAVTYNLTNAFAGFKPNRRNNIYAHLGPCVAFREEIKPSGEANVGDWLIETREKKTFVGGRIGLNYIYNISNWVAFTADFSATLYPDDFSGNAWDIPVDTRLSAGVGFRVYLTKSKKPEVEYVYRDEIHVLHDTIRVHEERDKYVQDVYPIYFATNKADIKSANTADLKTVADLLTENPMKIVYVLGYADKNSEGKNADKLANDRAEAISEELISKYGVEADRVITHHIGTKDQPYLKQAEKNQATICIITDLKHF